MKPPHVPIDAIQTADKLPSPTSASAIVEQERRLISNVGSAPMEPVAPIAAEPALTLTIHFPSAAYAEKLDALARFRGKSPESCILDFIAASQPGGSG